MIKPHISCKIVILAVVLLCFRISLILAQITSATSGNWNSPSTWTGGIVPSIGDDVRIANGHTVTVTANASCASITFTGATGGLSVNSSVMLNVSGTITLRNQANANASCNVTGQGSIECQNIAVGSTDNAPTRNNTTRIHSFNSSVNSLNVASDITINSYFRNNNRRRNGIFALENGSVTVGGLIQTNNQNTLNISTFTMASGAQTGNLILYANNPFVLSGTGTNTIQLNGTTSLVNYNRDGNQTVLPTSYKNLTLSGSGIKTITGVTIEGVLSLEGTASTAGSSPSYGPGATLQYKGSSAQVTGIEFASPYTSTGGIVIDNSSGVSLSNSVTISSLLTLTNGSFFIGSNTLTLNGQPLAGTPSNLVTSVLSGLVFGGTSAGVFVPSSVINLNNLTINNPNGVVLTNDITISSGGTLTLLNGLLNAGEYIVRINNTDAVNSVVSSTSAFINVTSGGLIRAVAPNLTGTGNNYLFPIGEGGSYKAINLIDVNSGPEGPVLLASVNPSGATTGDNVTISGVDPRYWSLINTNGGDFTSARIELFEAGLTPDKTIGMSPAISGNYSTIGGTINPSSIVSVSVPNPGPYFCIGTLIYSTYYSYQTGEWNSPYSWTSDPSGTLQIGNTVPSNLSKVVILPERTISLTDNIDDYGLKIEIESGGILDMYSFSFTSGLDTLQGQGTLRLASDYFPLTTYNSFVETGGGTVEYYSNTDFTLPSYQSIYNNLIINTSTATATLLSNLVLNGTLNIRTGTFRVNDNTSTARLTLEINGDVTVDAGASITVGNGVTNTSIGGTGGSAPFLNYYLNFHTIIINGNLTNNGTVRFTNLEYPLYNAFPPTIPGPESGAATVYFQGTNDNTLTCNGTTDFYNLIIDKGIDQTYKLTIFSTAYTNFRLFGANTLAVDGTVSANPDLRKALWIRTGTLILKGKIVIPSLSEGVSANADYYIPSNGALEIDGVDVAILSTADDYRELNTAYSVSSPGNAAVGITTGGNSSLVVLGKFLVNNGFLSTRESAGIVTTSTSSGQLVINGGTIDTKQFLSATGSASFTQTGGLLILRGRFLRTPASYSSINDITDISLSTLNTSRATNGINPGYGTFNLENTANIFSFSGGTIRIYDVAGIAEGEQEAFDVKSSPANINVTGGTLEIAPSSGSVLPDATNYRLNSSAPIYNLTINRSGSTSVVSLSASLDILNSVSLLSGDLNANSFNLSVGGNFLIESGTSYITGTNTTTLNGTSNQTFTVNLSAPLLLNNFTISKPSGSKIILAGSQNTINITGNFNLTSALLEDGGKSLNVSGNIFNSGFHSGSGKIILNGTSPQSIDGAGIFTNVELDNSNVSTAPISLTANMTIKGILTFSRDKLFNIGTYNLKLDSFASISNYSSSRYIQTAGNTGDRGLTKVYSNIDAFTFPVGAPTLTPSRPVKYTPATIGFSTEPEQYGSVTVIPVGYEHPATTVNGQSLTYYWRVNSSGFSGIAPNSVTHSFVYDQSDVAGTEGNYIPSLYDRSTYNWFNGLSADINTSTNTISDWASPSNSTNFLNGDYTAGDASFGSPGIYYSRQSGIWSNVSTWSLSGHDIDDPPSSPPGLNDIVIIGGNDSIYLFNETPPFPIDNNNPAASYYQRNKAVVNCANLLIEAGAVLDIQNNPGSYFGSVISHPNGNGKIRITTRDASNFDNPEPFVYPSGDFSDFNINDGISEFYTINPQSGRYYILPSNASSYGTVILTPLRGSNIIMPNIPNVTIYGDLICSGSDADAWLAMSWTGEYGTVVAKTVNVNGSLRVLGGSFGFIYNGSTLQQININGDIFIAPGAGIDVWSSSTNNILTIGGNIYNNSDNSIAPLGTPSLMRFRNGTNICNVIFNGEESTVLSNNPALSTTPVTVFNAVTIDKGVSNETTVTWNIGGTLTTLTDNWLTLLNGTLVYDRTGNFTISQGTAFTIPSTAGLTLNTPSNVYIANSATNNKTLYLDGRLTILSGGGNVYIGPPGNTANNADIEYSGSGASSIEIHSGNLFVTGQIRRPVSSSNGILRYVQTGGNVIIYGNNSVLSKSKLEILNSGSEFTMTEGTLTIVRGGGTTFGDLYLRPSTGSVTGGTIYFSQVPVSGPVIDAVQSYLLDANIPLNNLTITGKTASTSRTATLNLLVSPLYLNGSLTLSNNQSVFNSNSKTVTIKGDLINSGTYVYGTNQTIFNGIIQTVSGSSITDFYDLIISPLTSISFNNNFTVNGNLDITTGNLILGSTRASLMGSLTNNGAYIDNNSTGGIVLQGSSQQQISGTGSFGRLVLNNSSGAKIMNDINIQNNLVLTSGVLDIGSFQLTLGQGSLIEGSPFNIGRMIKSDGVASSRGILKYFSASPQSFTFPSGVAGKYTPAVFVITSSAAVGSVRVNPVDNFHPNVTDQNNAVSYYWQIESEGLSGFSSEINLQYLQTDVFGSEPDFVASRLLISGNIWEKAPSGPLTDNVDESNNLIIFSYSNTNILTGDYTAANEASIPNEVPVYQTNSDGNWSDANIWTPVGTSPPCPADGPNGCNVIINHIITADRNFILSFNTTVNKELRIVAPTFGHNLGYVSGNGILYLEAGNLPGGIYTSFLNCEGNSRLEYGGSGTYTIISKLFNTAPNIFFTGTGTRKLPSTDLMICKRLVIDGPILDNTVNNTKLTLKGTFERYGTGGFRSGTGDFPSSAVIFAGSSKQSLGGQSGNFTGPDSFNNFVIDNPYGLEIATDGLIEIKNQLFLTDGIIYTTSADNLVHTNILASAVVPEGGRNTSYISGPYTKYIYNGDSFVYPIGKETVKSHSFTLISASSDILPWSVEYFRPNPTATSLASPLEVCNTLEYWSVSASTNAQAKLRIGWDPLSDLTPLMTTNGLSDMRVAVYNSDEWHEILSVASGNNYYGTVETAVTTTINTVPGHYTTASVTGTLARASLDHTGPICGESGIPVSFVSFSPISLNYILSYTIDGIAQPDVIVSSLPYVLPATIPGSYRLTGFKFNNGTGIGVVDATETNVYSLPTVSSAGEDLSYCGVSSAVLQGNDPSPYQGLWTIISGSGGSFTSNTQYNTTFNGVLGTSYTLRWTISNGPCTSSDDVIVSFPVVAAKPGEFTSVTVQVCRDISGYVYTVPFVAGVTYNWSYSGTGHTINGSGNSVTINFSPNATSGTLSVTATNDCGTSEARTVNIIVPSADFTYSSSTYCQNQPNPVPLLEPDAVAGLFSSSAGLIFQDPLTGEIDLSESVSGTYTVTNTANIPGCGLQSADFELTISGQTWTGAVNTNWNEPGNWSCGFVPYPVTHISIPEVVNKPVIESGITGTVNNISINSGSSLTITNGILRISGSVINNGLFAASDGTVELNGSSLQIISPGLFENNIVRDLIVNNPSGVSLQGSLNISGSLKITSGTLNSNGFLTLLSTPSQTAYVDGTGNGSINGNLTMQRYLPAAFGYKYISSPFTSATVNELADEVNLSDPFPVVYRYDESRTTSGWISYVNPAGLLTPLSGYAVNFGSSTDPVTADITGIVNNGPLEVTLYNNNNTYTQGFNLVGNPYPSPIDWDHATGWIKTNIDNALYFFKASTTDEYGGTYSTYINGISSDGIAGPIIPSMQGFFVHVSDGIYPVTGILGLDNNVRVTNQTQPFIKKGESARPGLLRLTAAYDDEIKYSDPAVIYIDTKASMNFDSELDALKLMNTDYDSPSFFSVSADAKKLSINSIPPLNVDPYKIPLGLRLYKKGFIVFRADELFEEISKMDIFLTDETLETSMKLSAGSYYRVFLNEGDHNNRFYLEINPVSTGIKPPAEIDKLFKIYSYRGTLFADIGVLPGNSGTIMICNLAGQILFSKKIDYPGQYEFNPGLKNGIYLVRFTTDRESTTQRIFIQNP